MEAEIRKKRGYYVSGCKGGGRRHCEYRGPLEARKAKESDYPTPKQQIKKQREINYKKTYRGEVSNTYYIRNSYKYIFS